jgi:hypothetical protein
VNSDLVPAIVAAGGGSALIGSIWTHERRRDEAMRASRVRLALRFPAAPDPAAAKAALSGLSGLSGVELLFEVAASDEGIRHFLWVPAAVRASVVSVLAGAMPGLRASEAPVPSGRATLALRVFIPTPTVLATENPEASSRTLLSGLATLAPGEQVVIRWAVRPSPAPQRRAAGPEATGAAPSVATEDTARRRLPNKCPRLGTRRARLSRPRTGRARCKCHS